MKEPEKKPVTKPPKIVWVLALICGLVSFAYYFSTGSSLTVAVFSAFIVFGLAMIAISFLAGCASGLMEAISSPDKKKPSGDQEENKAAIGSSEKAFRSETFEVAGTFYYRESIVSLVDQNPNWSKQGKALVNQGLAGKRVYRYKYIHKPAKLIQENDNSYDPNAVMVQVSGEKVGYISAEEAIHVRSILNAHSVEDVSAFVYGGDYKFIYEDGTVEKHEGNLHIRLTIEYR